MFAKLISVALLVVAAAAAAPAPEELAVSRNCQWDGSGPFCDGQCESPYSYLASYGGGGGGNGASCAFGTTKAFCCTTAAAGSGCAWYGTAPVCQGECPSGTVQVTTDGTGDGARCFSGNKVFCCPN